MVGCVGREVQFDALCHGVPGQMVVKKGDSILLDNRSSDTKTIKLDSQSYVLPGYNYKVVVVRCGSYFICDGVVNHKLCIALCVNLLGLCALELLFDAFTPSPRTTAHQCECAGSGEPHFFEELPSIEIDRFGSHLTFRDVPIGTNFNECHGKQATFLWKLNVGYISLP